jgi:ABC-type molybdate transport system substrate-binding protein
MPKAGRIAFVLLLAARLAFQSAQAENIPPIQVMAASSLKTAMTEMGAAFLTETKIPVDSRFGLAGILRDRLDKGESADLFASADMGNPVALAQAGKAGPVVLFALFMLSQTGQEILARNGFDAPLLLP